MYPYRTTAGEVAADRGALRAEQERWFEGVMLEAFRGWLELADERLTGTDVRCFVMPETTIPRAWRP